MKLFRITIMILLGLVLSSCKSAKYPNLEEGLYAEIQTPKGNILLQLEFEKTPVTVANFVSLAEGTNRQCDEQFKEKRYFDGIKFHRVVKDFMIQGGDPTGSGMGGPGYKFEDEFPMDENARLLLPHKGAGILSMANSGKNTNGSQFFITHKATPHLNGKHSVFGHVITGQNVVDSIAQGDVIEKVTIIRKGKKAKDYDAATIFDNYMISYEEQLRKKVEAQQKVAERKATYFTTQKAKAKTLPSGLKMLTIDKGSGVKPQTGSQVFINYAGYFTDGMLFDTSYIEIAKEYNKVDKRRKQAGKYRPFPRVYSTEARLIPGFREGMLRMNYGEKALLFIPSHLGYGEMGSGNVIPPNADLIFEIELVDDRKK